ncbi:sulfotransferase domain-containing protein [soil metagenome]|nr:sulfotransferase domain-containing protein [Rubrobacter sp.]
MRDLLHNARRSLERKVKGSPTSRAAFYRLRGAIHAARVKVSEARNGHPDQILSGPNPGNVVWIFCTSRSGSTWLRNMMRDLTDCEVWEEPKVGQLFGGFYDRALEGQLGSTNFVMGDPTRRVWMRALRNFVLDTARASHPNLTPSQHLVVKEPDGAIGAPLLMQALPESRMVFLIRDPRDIAASALDAHQEGNWMRTSHGTSRPGKGVSAERPEAFVRKRAVNYLKHMTKARDAYQAHDGRKTLVRYEDLRSDPLGTMRRVCRELGVPVDDEALVQAVERYSWERLPESEKGKGRFYRKGTPGGWREDLTNRQARIVEEVTAPLLREFYPDESQPRP